MKKDKICITRHKLFLYNKIGYIQQDVDLDLGAKKKKKKSKKAKEVDLPEVDQG